jgi:hypothetical protein
MLILLDIDGVMVKAQSWSQPEKLVDGFSQFLPNAVFNLNRILNETKASILLTTSHRNTYTEQQWVDIFRSRGVDVPSISMLPHDYDTLRPITRADEILRWSKTSENNDDFVIIDDDSSLNDLPDHIKSKCVITRGLIGLDNYVADQAIAILKQGA